MSGPEDRPQDDEPTDKKAAQHVTSLTGPAQEPTCTCKPSDLDYHEDQHGNNCELYRWCTGEFLTKWPEKLKPSAGASLAGTEPPKPIEGLDDSDMQAIDEIVKSRRQPVAGTEPEPRSGLVDLSNEHDRPLSFKRVAKHMMECFLEGEAENDLRLKMAEEYLTERFAPMLNPAVEAEIAALREQRSIGDWVSWEGQEGFVIERVARIEKSEEGTQVLWSEDGNPTARDVRIINVQRLIEDIICIAEIWKSHEADDPIDVVRDGVDCADEISDVLNHHLRALKTSASSGTK